MLTAYAIGITLDYFAINFIKLERFKYGVSFWVFVCSLILFVLVSVWENRKMSKLSRQEMVIRLLEKEKEILRGGSIDTDGAASNNSSDIFTI